jgi:hypothetical protein
VIAPRCCAAVFFCPNWGPRAPSFIAIQLITHTQDWQFLISSIWQIDNRCPSNAAQDSECLTWMAEPTTLREAPICWIHHTLSVWQRLLQSIILHQKRIIHCRVCLHRLAVDCKPFRWQELAPAASLPALQIGTWIGD